MRRFQKDQQTRRVIEGLLTDLAKKYGVTRDDVEQVIESQFKFVKHVMSTHEEAQVRLKYLGVFFSNKNKREWIKKARAKKAGD